MNDVYPCDCNKVIFCGLFSFFLFFLHENFLFQVLYFFMFQVTSITTKVTRKSHNKLCENGTTEKCQICTTEESAGVAAATGGQCSMSSDIHSTVIV